MIKVENLYKSFEDFKVLNNVNMQVKKGSIYGLVGPNGAGKTTLIKTLTGVYRPDEGRVRVMNDDVFENNAVKQKFVHIPDDLYFYPMYSTKQMAEFYRECYPSFSFERYEKIKTILKIDEKKRISKLSKGMKKQVAFWLAISAKPDLLVLDEPVDGLDPVMRRQIWSILMQDVAEREMTVLLSSHNLRELEDVCDHVGILHEGRIVLERDLDQLKTDIHKIQCAFSEEDKEDVFFSEYFQGTKQVMVLKKERIGRVVTLILRGQMEEIKKEMYRVEPLFVDFIPLTLEEIFVYELGGLGYENESILL